MRMCSVCSPCLSAQGRRITVETAEMFGTATLAGVKLTRSIPTELACPAGKADAFPAGTVVHVAQSPHWIRNTVDTRGSGGWATAYSPSGKWTGRGHLRTRPIRSYYATSFFVEGKDKEEVVYRVQPDAVLAESKAMPHDVRARLLEADADAGDGDDGDGDKELGNPDVIVDTEPDAHPSWEADDPPEARGMTVVTPQEVATPISAMMSLEREAQPLGWVPVEVSCCHYYIIRITKPSIIRITTVIP